MLCRDTTLENRDICASLASSFCTFCAFPHEEQYYWGMSKRDLVTDIILNMSVTYDEIYPNWSTF